MKSKKTKNHLFYFAFAAVIAIAVVNNLTRSKMTPLLVPNNSGVSKLETVDNILVGIFQDGHTALWDWSTLEQIEDFLAVSNRTVLLGSQHMVTVNNTGKKTMIQYSLPSGKKLNDMPVGRKDQDLWPRISPNKNDIVLIRRNPRDSKGNVLFELLLVDLVEELLSPLVVVTIQNEFEDVIEYVLDNQGIFYAVGSQSGQGRVVAVNMDTGKLAWDRVYENTEEFCSVVLSPDGQTVLAGNRNGILYKLDAENGDIAKPIQLLEEGETRPVTNDLSVLNLAFSPDGRFYVATIHPKVYILETATDRIVHQLAPADRLVSKVAFSPDNKFIATSDIRAGYPIKIWKFPEENKQ